MKHSSRPSVFIAFKQKVQQLQNLLANHPLFVILLLILFATVLISLTLGNYPISIPKVVKILLWSDDSAINKIDRHVVFHIRLPRIILAFCVGASLAICGAVLQGVFYNPLVDPHVIGVTSGAAFGGTLAILIGFGTFGLILSAFSFGVIALAIILFLSSLFRQYNLLILILVGVVLNGFFSALVSLLQYMVDTEEKLPNIVFWLMGSFATVDWQKVAVMVFPTFIIGYILIKLSWKINVLSLSEEEASLLGINVKWLRTMILFLCAILVALQVSVSGSIGWAGLIMPHFARILVGANHERLLPISFLLGGIYMIIVDDIARTLTSAEIPITIITAIIGAPCFLILLYRQMRHQ